MKKMLVWLVVVIMAVMGTTYAIAEVDGAVFESFEETLVDELEGTAVVDCRYIPAGDAICITLEMSNLTSSAWGSMDYNTQLEAMEIFQMFVTSISDTSEQLFGDIPTLIVFQSQDAIPVDAYLNRAQITWILN